MHQGLQFRDRGVSLDVEKEILDAQLSVEIIRHSPDAILVATIDGNILLANHSACHLLQRSEEELIQSGITQITQPAESEMGSLLEATLREGRVQRELWIRSKPENFLRIDVTAVALEIEAEQRIVLFLRDVSGKHQWEYEQRLLETAITDSPVLVCVVDEDWRILWANQAMERVSGYSLSQLVQKRSPMRRYLDSEDPKCRDQIDAQLESEGKWTGEVFTRRRNGQLYPLYGTISRVESQVPGRYHYVTILADISVVRENERKLRHISHYDPITELPNRTLFEQQVELLIGRSNPRDASQFLMMIDIDQFRVINETFGYETADRLIREIADRLRPEAGDGVILARHMSDKFALFCSASEGAEEVGLICQRVQEAIREPIDLSGHIIALTAGIGISCYPEDGETVDRLLQCAQIALRRIKEEGGDGYAFYRQGLEEKSRRFVEMVGPLHQALENGEFEAYFQPVVDSRSGAVVSMEVLARWHREDGTIVLPSEFIPVAERTSLIVPISEEITRQACVHLRRLDQEGFRGLSISINLSARQFRDVEMAPHLISLIAKEGIEHKRVLLEITESLIMDHPEEKAKVLQELQEQGMCVIIDDFGTGYCSFAYLKHFYVNGIKLDRIFVQDIGKHPKGASLVAMMLGLGHGLDIPVVAEGVETEVQAEFLRRHGCQRIQGYWIAKPMPSSEFIDYLKAQRVA